MDTAHADGRVVITVSREELSLLAGCVNEALQIDDWELPIRLGATKALTSRLLDQLTAALAGSPGAVLPAEDEAVDPGCASTS